MKALLLLALALPAAAADVPFYLREIKTERDVSAVNENFRSLVNDLTLLRADVDAGTGGTSSSSGGLTEDTTAEITAPWTFLSTITVAGAAHFYRGVSSGTGSNVASVTFSGFSSSVSYRMTVQVESVDGTNNTLYLKFNGDGGATYAWGNVIQRTCSGGTSTQGENATSCRITGNVSTVGRPASMTFAMLRSAFGNPTKVHAHGNMNFDESCGSQQGSGGAFTCGYNGSANFSSFTFGKTSGNFNYEIKIEKNDF